MEEREPIQVSFRLPAGALEGLNRLVEQLRLLAAEVGGGAESPASPPAEYGRNDAFDTQRYEGLRQEAEMEPVQTAQAEFSSLEEAQTVRAEATVHMDGPTGAAKAAGTAFAEAKEAEAVRADISQEGVRESPTAETARQEPQKEAEAVRMETESPLDGPEAVRTKPESSVPAAEPAWAGSGREELAVRAVETGAFSSGAEARSAGFTPASVPAEASGKWGGMARELTAEEPAPLTAEAVSLAFRRDGRRYDNGFPLY